MTDLFRSLRRNKGDVDELIKQNMLKRFREIQQEHEKEYTRLNVSFLCNFKGKIYRVLLSIIRKN